MPTFKFKNGETITANSLDEARTMRKSVSTPAVPSAPQSSGRPLDIFKDPNAQKKILGSAKTGSELLKAAAGLQTVTGTDKTLKDKFDPNDAIKNILAMRILKRRLGDIVSLKQGFDKEGRVAGFYK